MLITQWREVVNVLATEFSAPILNQRRSGALNAATRQSWPRYISTGDFDWEHPLHVGRCNPPRGGFYPVQRTPKRQLIAFYQMVREILSRRHSHGFWAESSRDLAIFGWLDDKTRSTSHPNQCFQRSGWDVKQCSLRRGLRTLWSTLPLGGQPLPAALQIALEPAIPVIPLLTGAIERLPLHEVLQIGGHSAALSTSASEVAASIQIVERSSRHTLANLPMRSAAIRLSPVQRLGFQALRRFPGKRVLPRT